MGLRDKAHGFRGSGSFDRLDNLEEAFEGRIPQKEELLELKEEINRRLAAVTEKLDRKLIEMQTLIEIGRELNSTLSTSDLVQIVAFTLMGQFRVSDIAVWSVQNGKASIADRKGFASMEEGQLAGEFLVHLASRETALPVSDITLFKKEYTLFDRADCRLVVPMKGKEGLQGFLALGGKPEGEFYTDEERGMIYTLASLAGIALENARLYEELKNANARLDRKLSELSTLYEVSRVINSSSDFETVAALVCETIGTGFGVDKALLFLSEEGGLVIRNVIGLPAETRGQALRLSAAEEKLFAENRSGVTEVNPMLREVAKPSAHSLFVPMYASGRPVGGLLVLSSTRYDLRGGDSDLLSLFTIIASQAAPPLDLTRILQDEKQSVRDPWSPVIDRMGEEIEAARKFGVSVTFLMARLANYRKYLEFYGSGETFRRIADFADRVRQALPASGSAIRYNSNRILVILPAIPDSDLEDARDSIITAAAEVFKNEKEIDIGLDLLTAGYPDTSEDRYALLTLLE